MMVIIQACTVCRGDGMRCVPANADPMMNVAGLMPERLPDGRMFWTGPCHVCDGRGFFEWHRGRSLTPLAGGR